MTTTVENIYSETVLPLAISQKLELMKRIAQDLAELEEIDEKDWETLNKRRFELIEKKVYGKVTKTEQRELDQLQAKADQYLDRIAPRPIEELEKLHQQLLDKAQS